MKEEQLQKEIGWLLKEKYKGKLTAAAKRDLVRLKAGEPVDYLIGFVEFAGCKIDLSLKPLIPRPETEYWVEKALEEIKYKIQNTRYKIQVLDMFAGSGCIGIAVLKNIDKAHVDFVEKKKRFLRQIRINAKLNHINPRGYRILEGNIFQLKGVSVERSMGLYDYIFANPPYVAEPRKKSVQASVLKYEPREALFAGKDGLLYIKRFLKEARKHLNPGGKIYMEFDSPQKQEIGMLLKKFGYSSWQFYKDQYNKWRFVLISSIPFT